VEEEEIALLEEQLASAHADLERLNAQLAETRDRVGFLEREVETLRRQVEEAKRTLSERDADLAAQADEIEALRAVAAAADGRLAAAARRYRDVLLAAEPELPADLIAGDSIEAVDESVARARTTVAQVRQHLEQQARELRVSPGAPARAGRDLAGLSAAEKIRLGLQQS
jgi:chromosome segregation ATPase